MSVETVTRPPGGTTLGMHAPGVTDEIDRLTSASDTQLSDVQLAGMAAVYRKTSEEI